MAVAKQDGAERDDDTKEDDVVMRIQAGEHFRCVRHGGEIGANRDRVRDQQPQAGRDHEWSRKFLAECAGQSPAGDQADTHTHHLNCSDERPGDECRP